MALEAGSKLGHYEIVSSLGVGGMGEVYRATDLKLGREVALKLLLEEVSADPERLARFEREARVLASLNHDRIATLHGFEREGDTHFLVMELVEGETLADRITNGPLPLDEALPVFLHIAEGLEAAHAKGVIHRDLKPANIKISADGRVKILDFGLAKAMADEVDSPSPSASMSPTLTLAATQRGEILGTAAYMAPEQAKGKPVDRRADVWAFGVCLFEALSGQRAFRGNDASDLLAAVLLTEPDWSALPEGTPWLLERLLKRCLAKERGRRVRDIGDVSLELAAISESPPDPERGPEAQQVSTRRRGVLPWALAAFTLGGLLVGSAVWITARRSPRTSTIPVRSILSAPPSKAPGISSTWVDIALTPDGRTVVYLATDGELYARPVDQMEGYPLTESKRPYAPFVSPDGAWVGFTALDATVGAIQKVSIRGGPAVSICKAAGVPTGAAWGDDGTIVFGLVGKGLYRVSEAGGEPEQILSPDADAGDQDLRFPQILPDGRGVLFTAQRGGGFETAEIAVLDLESGRRKSLLRGGGMARYVPSGHLVYGVVGGLQAVPFDLETLEVTGSPVPVLDRVVVKGNILAADFAVSADGSLAYVFAGSSAVARKRLSRVDRSGLEESLGLPDGDYIYPRLSPDGRHLAVADVGRREDVWIWDLDRMTATRLTFNDGSDYYSVWTPDGREVIFSSSDGRSFDVFRKAADGSGQIERLTDEPLDLYPSSVSPDGRFLVIRSGQTTSEDLWLLSLDEGGELVPLLSGEYDEANGEISPDGRFLSYDSNESGRWEVYVRPFPDVDAGRWQISAGGGREPLWSPDGGELFYRGDGRLMSVPVKTDGGFESGRPVPVFEDHYGRRQGRFYDIFPDGRSFVVVGTVGSMDEDEGGIPSQVVLVQNWLDELERLLPHE